MFSHTLVTLQHQAQRKREEAGLAVYAPSATIPERQRLQQVLVDVPDETLLEHGGGTPYGRTLGVIECVTLKTVRYSLTGSDISTVWW